MARVQEKHKQKRLHLARLTPLLQRLPASVKKIPTALCDHRTSAPCPQIHPRIRNLITMLIKDTPLPHTVKGCAFSPLTLKSNQMNLEQEHSWNLTCRLSYLLFGIFCVRTVFNTIWITNLREISVPDSVSSKTIYSPGQDKVTGSPSAKRYFPVESRLVNPAQAFGAAPRGDAPSSATPAWTWRCGQLSQDDRLPKPELGKGLCRPKPQPAPGGSSATPPWYVFQRLLYRTGPFHSTPAVRQRQKRRKL